MTSTHQPSNDESRKERRGVVFLSLGLIAIGSLVVAGFLDTVTIASNDYGLVISVGLACTLISVGGLFMLLRRARQKLLRCCLFGFIGLNALLWSDLVARLVNWLFEYGAH
jgi:hypothetical protein